MKKSLKAVLAALLFAVGAVAPSMARITGTPPSSADIWCVGPSGAEACVNAAGDVIPTTTNDTDLGTSSLLWNELHLTAGGITDAAIVTPDLVAGAITSPKVVDGSIITAKIADGSITSVKIGVGEVLTAKIADGAVASAKIVDGAIITGKLESGAVTTPKIMAGAVTTAKLMLDLPTLQVACVTTGRLLGSCFQVTAGTGVCADCR